MGDHAAMPSPGQPRGKRPSGDPTFDSTPSPAGRNRSTRAVRDSPPRRQGALDLGFEFLHEPLRVFVPVPRPPVVPEDAPVGPDQVESWNHLVPGDSSPGGERPEPGDGLVLHPIPAGPRNGELLD